jgi:hypothetical protein
MKTALRLQGRTSSETDCGEANEAGYQLLEQDDFVKDGMDYFLVFGAK